MKKQIIERVLTRKQWTVITEREYLHLKSYARRWKVELETRGEFGNELHPFSVRGI